MVKTKLDDIILIRLSKKEKNRLAAIADSLGLNVSAWIRMVLKKQK